MFSFQAGGLASTGTKPILDLGNTQIPIINKCISITYFYRFWYYSIHHTNIILFCRLIYTYFKKSSNGD